MLQRLKKWAGKLKKDSTVLKVALSDTRTPWYARWMGVLVLAYALSPVDLIPDFIPILGYLDDLLILPVGLYLTIKLIPEPVLANARESVEREPKTETRPNCVVGSIIIVIWLAALGMVAVAGVRHIYSV